MSYNTNYACIAVLGTSCILVGAGCISSDSKLLDATEGCDEYEAGDVESLDLDVDAREFVVASADVERALSSITDDVYDACAAIARDLGEEDTWSDRPELKEKISNSDETGACDVATRALGRRIEEADKAGVTIRLAVDKGECHIDYAEQQACDARCAANPSCEPGPITTRCEPAKITAFCQGSCELDAYCVGNVEVAAKCEGHCEGACSGACEGTCYRDDGTVTEDDPDCKGVCEGRLSGECFGHCKVEATGGVECGRKVRCQGGCSGELEQPACTSEYGPPECSVNAACYEACKTEIAQTAVCEPCVVQVIVKADEDADAEVKELVSVIETHLPALVDAAENDGLLIKAAAERMADAGGPISDNVEDLNGKSLACVAAASGSLGERVQTLDVAIKASVKVNARVESDRTKSNR